MEAQYRRINVLANNAANVNSPGYKSSDLSFSEFGQELVRRIDENGSPEVGTISDYTGLSAENTDFSAGSYEQTGVSTDFAIDGEGFFAVQDAGGAAKYTRAGDFSVDTGGYLALPTGERLLGENGQPLHAGTDKITVAGDGTVTTAAGTAGKIALYTAPKGSVTRRDDGFFGLAGAVQAGGVLRQGWIEDSNTDVVGNMTGMMAATRSFQGCQQAFEISDDTYDKTVQLGSLK